jgi:HEAT repeat protein
LSEAESNLNNSEQGYIKSLVESLSSTDHKERWNAARLLGAADDSWTNYADKETIESLMNDLCDENELVRIIARRLLIVLKDKAVDALVNGLKNPNHLVKEESAKALAQLQNPATADALIGALEDEIFDVRWLAGEGLIALRLHALEPLLRALVYKHDSIWLREGIHRVLHGIYQENPTPVIKPVLSALESAESHLTVPVAADAALKVLKESKSVSQPP